MGMRCFFALIAFVTAAAPLAAGDEARLALMLQAQTDFDRVALSGIGQLAPAAACVQSQAAALATAAPPDAPLLHYRKGFCLLAEAAVTRRPEQYTEAAGEFDAAVQAWTQAAPAAKNVAPEPVSPGLRTLADIARLQSGRNDNGELDVARADLASAVQAPVCTSRVMPAVFCQEVVSKGREWIGRMALERGDFSESSRDFTGSDDGWSDFAAARQAFAARRYGEAVADYQSAVTRWDADRKASAPTLIQSLAPRPDYPGALADLGGAQLLAGDPAAAIQTLDRAIHEDPSRPRALYLRARAREVAGDSTGALADYNLASRAAFAAAKDLASGEAHLYRGILLYRRNDLGRAEDEFSSALNFQISAALRTDAQAWRYLAAVAAGSCGESRDLLVRSLDSVSPYFPSDEARATAANCHATARSR